MQNYQKFKDLAPIVLFTYNRLNETIQTVEALKNNFLARQSVLYIFSDGAKDSNGVQKVDAVRNYLSSIDGFKSVEIYKSEQNLGLANSIIRGVSTVIGRYGKIIVLEDDLVTSRNFLNFMNQALDYYQDDEIVFSISGYTLDLPILRTYSKDFYVTKRALSLGWGTWNNRWKDVDWEVKDYKQFSRNLSDKYRFFEIGSDLPGMLKNQMDGKIDSWAIRWCYHQFRKELLTIFSSTSKVNHIGDGADATHAAGSTKFITPLDDSNQIEFSFDNKLELNPILNKQFKYKFSLSYRIKSKIKRFIR